MAQNTIVQFHTVPRTELLYGDTCGICCEPYSTEDDAVRLPCGHELGSMCISAWLSPEGGKHTCPLCRCQLFPRAPEVEGTHEIRDLVDGDDILNDDERWENTYVSTTLGVDATLRALGLVHRDRGFRDWFLYQQLHGQDATNLPPWRANPINLLPRLDSSEEEALFQELERRGAFRLLPMPVGPLATDRQIWDFLRDNGYSYDPTYAAIAGGCAWSRLAPPGYGGYRVGNGGRYG